MDRPTDTLNPAKLQPENHLCNLPDYIQGFLEDVGKGSAAVVLDPAAATILVQQDGKPDLIISDCPHELLDQFKTAVAKCKP